MSTPRNGELLLMVLAVVRWGTGGPGTCFDCHQHAEDRHTVEPTAPYPNGRDLRFLQVTGPATTRATSRIIDEWAWSVMQAQLGYRPMARKPPKPQRLCWNCVAQRLDAYQENGTGTDAAIVGALAHDLAGQRSYTVIFNAMQAGHDHQRIDKFLGQGVGSVNVRKLVQQGIADWRKKYQPVSA